MLGSQPKCFQSRLPTHLSFEAPITLVHIMFQSVDVTLKLSFIAKCLDHDIISTTLNIPVYFFVCWYK